MTSRVLHTLSVRHTTPLALLAAVALLAGIAETVAQDVARPTAVPSPSDEDAIARFVTECVSIVPGKDNFPAKFSVGTKAPATHELPRKDAGLSMRFRISRFETTQELYQAVIGGNPSRWQGPRNSVENVNYKDVERFCQKLTALLHHRKLILKNEIVRLPTSVEWEYCCRAGSQTRYCFGEDAGTNGGTQTLDEFAWHTGNAAGNDPAVGVLKPNEWGLYDVHGYLWEFVAADASSGNRTDSGQQMIRGGSWRDHHSRLSCSSWATISGDDANDAVGFRCVIAEKPMIKKPQQQ